MILWAVRRCYVAGRYGVSMLCRVMSRPSWICFKEAMNLIKWIWQRRHIGLRFSANGNALLLGMVDASNKPDRADGKCQYGFYIFLAGAPVLDISKKLRHIGLSSEHNEYMALYFANQAVVWLRQLFKEMSLLQVSGETYSDAGRQYSS